MEKLISQQFYNDGWHVENSDKYHWYVLDLFKNFLDFDTYQNSNYIKSVIQKAEIVKYYTLFPNNETLMIADSEYKIRKSIEHKKDELKFKIFGEAGYVFVKDKDSMLFFQTAFKNTTHRHADDFNVLLYEYGTNILVDVGQYAYSKDKERGYALSTRAHNCVLIDNQNYKIDRKYFYESVLKEGLKKDGIFILKTALQRKDIQVSHNRIILYKPKEFLIVVDKLNSDTQRTYNQVWHFHQDLDLVENRGEYLTDVNGVKLTITPMIFQGKKFILNHNTKLIKGQKEPYLQGWRSLKYRELIPNFALENEIEADNAILLTKFVFNDNDLDIDMNNNMFFIKSKKLNLDLQTLV